MSVTHHRFLYWKVGFLLILLAAGTTFGVTYVSKESNECGWGCALYEVSDAVGSTRTDIQEVLKEMCEAVSGPIPEALPFSVFRLRYYGDCFLGPEEELRQMRDEAASRHRLEAASESAGLMALIASLAVIVFWPLLRTFQAVLLWSDVKRTELLARKAEAQRILDKKSDQSD